MKGYNRDNVKLSFGKPVFYINEKKRTVTCSLSALLIGPFDVNATRKNNNFNFYGKPLKTVATARCHENDVFDVERGKRIALAKAENNLYSQASIIISELCESLDFLRTACNDFFGKSIRCQAHNIDYIDSLTIPAHPMYNKNLLPRKRGVEKVHIK